VLLVDARLGPALADRDEVSSEAPCRALGGHQGGVGGGQALLQLAPGDYPLGLGELPGGPHPGELA